MMVVVMTVETVMKTMAMLRMLVEIMVVMR